MRFTEGEPESIMPIMPRLREFRATVEINGCKYTKLLVSDGRCKQFPLLTNCVTCQQICKQRALLATDRTECYGRCKQCRKQRVINIHELLLIFIFSVKIVFIYKSDNMKT